MINTMIHQLHYIHQGMVTTDNCVAENGGGYVLKGYGKVNL